MTFVSFSAGILTVALLAAVGCNSPDSRLIDQRGLAYAAMANGEAAFAAKDYKKAAESFKQAIETGVLNPDLYADASVKLAVSFGATDQFDPALALLEQLEQNAPNLDQIYAARSYVLAKQGKAAESRAALAKARQFNRSAQEFKD
jgi:tetratricopeptide (TPR) repeat protein